MKRQKWLMGVLAVMLLASLVLTMVAFILYPQQMPARQSRITTARAAQV